MDNDCRHVVLECPKCKHFGLSFHNALFQPIRRLRPFTHICGDYLALSLGHSSFKHIGLYIYVYSGFVWGVKLKTAGTAKSTTSSLAHIFTNYATPDVFMADGGRHFNNDDVKPTAIHTMLGITTATWAPWCNGLIEGTKKLLLGRLHCLCAPNMDECIEDNIDFDPESLPHSWPLHFKEAITPEHRAPTTIPETTTESVSDNLALSDKAEHKSGLPAAHYRYTCGKTHGYGNSRV
jgi:hypothetical protein